MRSKIYGANHFCYILCMCKISIFSDRKNQLDSSEKIPCHCFFTGCVRTTSILYSIYLFSHSFWYFCRCIFQGSVFTQVSLKKNKSFFLLLSSVFLFKTPFPGTPIRCCWCTGPRRFSIRLKMEEESSKFWRMALSL